MRTRKAVGLAKPGTAKGKKAATGNSQRPVTNNRHDPVVLNIGGSQIKMDDSPLVAPTMNFDSGENDVDILPSGKKVKESTSDEPVRSKSDGDQGEGGDGPDNDTPLVVPNTWHTTSFPTQW